MCEVAVFLFAIFAFGIEKVNCDVVASGCVICSYEVCFLFWDAPNRLFGVEPCEESEINITSPVGLSGVDARDAAISSCSASWSMTDTGSISDKNKSKAASESIELVIV